MVKTSLYILNKFYLCVLYKCPNIISKLNICTLLLKLMKSTIQNETNYFKSQFFRAHQAIKQTKSIEIVSLLGMTFLFYCKKS